MLEGVAIVLHVVVVVVGIGKERVSRSEGVGRAHIGSRQLSFFGRFDGEDLFGVVVEVLSQFISQIGVGVAVTDDLDGLLTTDGTMVSGKDDAVIALRQQSEKLADDRVAEPALRDAAVGSLVAGEFAYHL